MTLMNITPPNLVGLQEQFYNRGVLDERERIINLLEAAREAQPCGCDDCGDHVWGKAIEVIKGEQK